MMNNSRNEAAALDLLFKESASAEIEYALKHAKQTPDYTTQPRQPKVFRLMKDAPKPALTIEQRHPVQCLLKRTVELVLCLALTKPALYAFTLFNLWPLLRHGRKVKLQHEETIGKHLKVFKRIRCADNRVLDTLFSLYHVVLGHLSLVGPRPYLAEEAHLFTSPALHRRFEVAPGLTGLEQLRHRGMIGAPVKQVAALDEAYLNTWSLASDISILKKHLFERAFPQS